MEMRFSNDPETGEPHISGHGVTEAEVRHVLCDPEGGKGGVVLAEAEDCRLSFMLSTETTVAVGTPVARRPPHGSVRGGLLHTALTWGW